MRSSCLWRAVRLKCEVAHAHRHKRKQPANVLVRVSDGCVCVAHRSSPLPLLLSSLSSSLPPCFRSGGLALLRVSVAVDERLAADVRRHGAVPVGDPRRHQSLPAATQREINVGHVSLISLPVTPTISASSSPSSPAPEPASEPLSCTAGCQLGGTNAGAALLLVLGVVGAGAGVGNGAVRGQMMVSQSANH